MDAGGGEKCLDPKAENPDVPYGQRPGAPEDPTDEDFRYVEAIEDTLIPPAGPQTISLRYFGEQKPTNANGH